MVKQTKDFRLKGIYWQNLGIIHCALFQWGSVVIGGKMPITQLKECVFSDIKRYKDRCTQQPHKAGDLCCLHPYSSRIPLRILSTD